MTNRPNKPLKKTPEPAPSQPEKPYAFVSFPKQSPPQKPPAGHHKYLANAYHGTIELTLEVATALHISTGVVALGSDVGSRVPLIKTMVQGQDKRLIIQGSSLKGCIRAIYEAITNSTLGVVTGRYRQLVPPQRMPCRTKERLCPASQVFGALDWQGLVQFNDAQCQSVQSSTGYLPSLYRPRPNEQAQAAGRKFYRHAVRAVATGERGTPVQQAGTKYTFSTQIQVMNLSKAQLGALFIALGQDEQYPMALKLGGGKPVGLGTMLVTVASLELMQDVRDRYLDYATPESAKLTGEPLKALVQQAVRQAHQEKLIEEPQLKELSQILRWPTTYEAPTGMY